MAEPLDPAPDEFVLRVSEPAESVLDRARQMGSVEQLDAAKLLLLLRVAGSKSAKQTWHGLSRKLGPDAGVFPVLYDRDGSPHYPTGEVTVRFDVAPTDAELDRFCEDQRLRLLRRNEFVAQQVVCEALAPAREFLPELVKRLAAQPGVRTAWANTLSRYRRADKG